jgi:hypothetical protein
MLFRRSLIDNDPIHGSWLRRLLVGVIRTLAGLTRLHLLHGHLDDEMVVLLIILPKIVQVRLHVHRRLLISLHV